MSIKNKNTLKSIGKYFVEIFATIMSFMFGNKPENYYSTVENYSAESSPICA